jgi:hypothetical protein
LTRIAKFPGNDPKGEPAAGSAQSGWTTPQLVRLAPGEAAHLRALNAFAQARTRAA